MSTLHQKLEEEQREAAARGKKSMCQNAVDGVTKCFTENKPKVEHLCGDLKRRGACTKFGEFTKNLFLIRPLGRMKNAQELVFNKTPADSNGSASDPAVDALRLI
ncbi:MAG: hypothetical protein SGPRY_001122 [Prymnesium sp.]